ncbi:hypothetical protein N8456_08905 [Porticoccaceae bacterium]|nr:hypothetical protein [Porticoccaceae bacterium]
MSVISTNVSATITSNALAKNDRAMSQSMERLSLLTLLQMMPPAWLSLLK